MCKTERVFFCPLFSNEMSPCLILKNTFCTSINVRDMTLVKSYKNPLTNLYQLKVTDTYKHNTGPSDKTIIIMVTFLLKILL